MSPDEGWEEPAVGSRNTDKGNIEPHFHSVEDFVSNFLALVTERRTGGPVVWCSSWWSHPEAVARLTALWRAWEALRLEAATGMSNWWTLHFDPHMRVILDGERGPFSARQSCQWTSAVSSAAKSPRSSSSGSRSSAEGLGQGARTIDVSGRRRTVPV
jgi:hypothetical protein